MKLAMQSSALTEQLFASAAEAAVGQLERGQSNEKVIHDTITTWSHVPR